MIGGAFILDYFLKNVNIKLEFFLNFIREVLICYTQKFLSFAKTEILVLQGSKKNVALVMQQFGVGKYRTLT